MVIEKVGEVMSEKILRLRKELNLTQGEFGSLLSVSRQAVSKWELGQSTPDVETLRRIKQLFGLTYDELLDDDKPVEFKNDVIFELRQKRYRFYYSLVLIVIALVFFLYYISIRINGTYDAFIFNYDLRVIQTQKGYDWLYYFIKIGLLLFSGLFCLIGLCFAYFSQRKRGE